MNIGPKHQLLVSLISNHRYRPRKMYSNQPIVYKQILSKLMTFQIASEIGYFVYLAKLKMLIC